MSINLKLEESKVLLPVTALAYGPSPRAPAHEESVVLLSIFTAWQAYVGHRRMQPVLQRCSLVLMAAAAVRVTSLGCQ